MSSKGIGRLNLVASSRDFYDIIPRTCSCRAVLTNLGMHHLAVWGEDVKTCNEAVYICVVSDGHVSSHARQIETHCGRAERQPPAQQSTGKSQGVAFWKTVLGVVGSLASETWAGTSITVKNTLASAIQLNSGSSLSVLHWLSCQGYHAPLSGKHRSPCALCPYSCKCLRQETVSECVRLALKLYKYLCFNTSSDRTMLPYFQGMN